MIEYTFNIHDNDSNVFVVCGGWITAQLPWPSYVRFEEAQPDQIGDAVWTESNKLMPSNPKRVVILSNYRWSFAGAMEQVMGPKFKVSYLRFLHSLQQD